MRRLAGSFVRNKLILSCLVGCIFLGIAFGLVAGNLLYIVFGIWIGNFWIMIASYAVAAAIMVAVYALFRSSGDWSLDNLEKGSFAETLVGEVIEYAITVGNCAVAHNVTKIAKVGDIDHIVATPKRVWVVETKYRKVPPKTFPDVLSRIAANSEAVRQWAPAGTPVRGCLVLAYEPDFKPKPFWHRKEKISAHTPHSLMRELKSEARKAQSLDRQIVKDVWGLGRVPEFDTIR